MHEAKEAMEAGAAEAVVPTDTKHMVPETGEATEVGPFSLGCLMSQSRTKVGGKPAVPGGPSSVCHGGTPPMIRPGIFDTASKLLQDLRDTHKA